MDILKGRRAVESSMMGDTFLEKIRRSFLVEFEEEGGAGGDEFFLKFGVPPGALADTLPTLHWET